MPTRNQLLDAFREMGVLLELDGANTFKSGAYSKAVRILGDESIDIGEHVQKHSLTSINGIGKGIAEKIEEFWSKGSIGELEELRAKFPAGLVEMTAIPGFGAKKARAVFQELGVTNIEELQRAAEDGRLADLKGFGKKTAEKILDGIAQHRRHQGRHRIDTAWQAARPILEALRGHKAVQRAETAGSLRRWRESAKDIDFVCATENPKDVMEFFAALEGVEAVIGRGDTKASVRLANGINADLRCVAPAQFAYALAHFTGSKEHNVRLRQRAIERGLKLNEYGLFPEGKDVPLEAKDEAAIHDHLGLPFIAPELREDMGEIEAAADNALPNLIVREDIVGLMHMHTTYSDGQPAVEDYAAWAHRNGIAWMGIADHSQSAVYAGGLKPEAVRAQWREIDEVNKRWEKKGVRLLKGIESDILVDGSLDYDDELLGGFEFVVASVHSRFNLSEDEQTRRVIAAVEHPRTTILGHMTGRLILRRDGFALRQKDVIKACAAAGTVIEINANPHRLDLDWRLVHYAIDQGCLLSIGPDAHAIAGLDDVRYGLGAARKGWATKDDIVNCWSADKFIAYARDKKKR
ncbi:MAG: polymerase [Candidatus Sumerlaeota bacterium]|nr:polymerase [Candidatus Sumerlaeota bacterium]